MIAFVLACASVQSAATRDAVSVLDAQPAPTAPTPADTRQAAKMMENDLIHEAYNEVFQRTRQVYGEKAFGLLVLELDTLGPGRDNWRTCGKLRPEDFGLTAYVASRVLDVDGRDCQARPDTVMGYLIVGGDPDDLSHPTNSRYADESMIFTAYLEVFDRY